ncbi:MAG: bifunctional proline dehydrogenase/L-glutamate gamma-semialdehyde dehydrogenase PutA [Thiogranum sp.]|nr:bifunctional proline dehydrogenase/L-glutamate gamma-semialdehyde dehydrogenase PutA [Thiogranum sp.]
MPAAYSETHPDALRQQIRESYRMDERQCLTQLLAQARLDAQREQRIQETARVLAEAVRRHGRQQSGVEAFLHEYDLSSREGVLLMCIAEALLRIPDADTADRLIRDRLSRGQWDEHLGASDSLLVNASTWGLLLTGQLFGADVDSGQGAQQLLSRLVSRAGEPIVRKAMQQAMRILARQFVMGRDISDALQRTASDQPGLLYSYDCLGEAAHTAADVERYHAAYRSAIDAVGRAAPPAATVFERPGVSIKLSALHPRYEFAQRERVLAELLPRLVQLTEQAASAGIGLTLDAEEADRLELSLDVFERLAAHVHGVAWDGLGMAVQAYQKRAWPLLHWLRRIAQLQQRRIPVRLVKGAYWDSEIKRAQVLGLDGYPVFTRKTATDVCFLACAKFLMENTDCLYPQLASHNALTVAWVHEIGRDESWELQRLHGMGEGLYALLDEHLDAPPPVRIYAPVGGHEELLPYLVRRLLENGANSSFINRLHDARTSIDELVTNPCAHIASVQCRPHPHIPLPADIYATQRRNSRGPDLSDPLVVNALEKQLQACARETWNAAARIGGKELEGERRPVTNPASGAVIGQVVEADRQAVEHALRLAADASPVWDRMGGRKRAACLWQAAELFEQEADRLIARVVREGGRTIADAIGEVREAVDYCRYYARQAETEFEEPVVLPGPTGESNELELHGRGVFACISPWNFPLAIFVGQIAGALAAGNAVLAKPARQTPLTGHLAIALMQQAGVPEDVLHFLPGSGSAIGGQLCADARVNGVAFTGSTDTAWTIQRALAERRDAIPALIAETGGQNVMIADSSALPEQLVVDVLQSAFNSAGQRCSALRVLFLQQEIADRTIDLLTGAMEELRVDDPMLLATDVGPVIDHRAIEDLQSHVVRMEREARLLNRVAVARHSAQGSYFPPQAFELSSLSLLDREVFGPILHVVRYRGDQLDAVIQAVNATGYGLTMGVHSRIEETWQRVCASARVGNLYLNRNMIGAVVGAQPFGGEGLSGTGPKAGGPYYMHRFATERTRSVNTAAVGGNTGLLTLPED